LPIGVANSSTDVVHLFTQIGGHRAPECPRFDAPDQRISGGIGLLDALTSPQALLDELDRVEQDSLEIVAQLHHFQDRHGRGNLNTWLPRQGGSSRRSWTSVHSTGSLHRSDAVDGELERLSDAVAHSDRMCFTNEFNLSGVMQLKTIEIELEQMDKLIERIDREFRGQRQI
jgi:hypothetical protein